MADIEYLEAKTILNRVKWGDTWFGNDFMINLYRGCNHNSQMSWKTSEKSFVGLLTVVQAMCIPCSF